jgi:UDP:flavonoid glycosyltransferase YjiC (YdhE family)
VRLPGRLCTPRAVRLAVERCLADTALRARARDVAAWTETHDPAARAAELVEGLAARVKTPSPA